MNFKDIGLLFSACLLAASSPSAQSAPSEAVRFPQTAPASPASGFPSADFLFQAYPRTTQDDAFAAFMAGRRAGALAPEDKASYAAQLQNYPLSDYIVAWNFYDAVKADPADEITLEQALAFIQDHRGEYVAERLGTDLARIYAPKGRFEVFQKLYAPLQWNKEEPDLKVWSEVFRLEQGEGSAGEACKLLAAAPSLRSDYSSALADAVLQRSPDQAWPVAFLLIQGRNLTKARQIASSYSQLSPGAVSSLFSNPSGFLEGTPAPDKDSFIAAVLLEGLKDPDAAAESLSAMPSGTSLSAQDLDLLWNFLGYRQALNGDFGSARLSFSKAASTKPNSALYQPDAVAEWRVRSSLALKDWGGVERTASLMSSSRQRDEGWQYWLGRARWETGRKAEAADILTPLTKKHSYYGKLACDLLNQDYPGESLPKPGISEADVRQWMQNPSIIRAIMLRRLRLYSMASREWNWALRGANQRQLAAAAEYARRIGLADRMINTAGKLSDETFLSQLSFPTPSLAMVSRIASEAQVPAAWVYGVIRQESRFMPAVSSGAGARGLMQLLTATAKWTAKQYGVSSDPANLDDPATNITLGSYYLKFLNDKFSGQKVLATAGYNAGPGRSVTWRARLSAPMEGAVFAELIPFRETRDYVKKVLGNTAEYQRILEPSQSRGTLSGLLGTISPAGAEQP